MARFSIVSILILLAVLTIPVMALTYEEMARYPDQNKGQPVQLTGEAQSVTYDYEQGYWSIHLYTGYNGYGYSDDDVFVIFKGLPTGERVLENDIVTITGLYGMPFQYETVLGAQREVPGIVGSTYLINHLNSKY